MGADSLFKKASFFAMDFAKLFCNGLAIYLFIYLFLSKCNSSDVKFAHPLDKLSFVGSLKVFKLLF